MRDLHKLTFSAFATCTKTINKCKINVSFIMIMSHIMPRTARTNGLEVSVFLLGVYTFARYVTSCYIHVTERVRVQCCAHLPKKNQFYPLVHAKTTNTVKITNVLNRDKIFLETLLRHARMSILFSYSILADRYYFAYHHFTYSTGFIFFPRTKAIFGVCSFSRFFFVLHLQWTESE